MKKYVFILGAMMAMGAGYFFGFFTEIFPGARLDKNELPVQESFAENKLALGFAEKELDEKPIKEDKPWLSMGDPATAEKVKLWFAERGNYSFYGPDAYGDYLTYDLETLNKLSDSGDIKAMHVLADRAGSFADLKKILSKAAIHGSTEAIIRLGSLNENDEGFIEHMSPEKRQAKILEALAHYEAAQLRGDLWGTIASGQSLLDRYKVDLSEEDLQYIKDRGRQIYDTLQAQRTEIGLGQFDNHIPEPVMNFYKAMERPM